MPVRPAASASQNACR